MAFNKDFTSKLSSYNISLKSSVQMKITVLQSISQILSKVCKKYIGIKNFMQKFRYKFTDLHSLSNRPKLRPLFWTLLHVKSLYKVPMIFEPIAKYRFYSE